MCRRNVEADVLNSHALAASRLAEETGGLARAEQMIHHPRLVTHGREVREVDHRQKVRIVLAARITRPLAAADATQVRLNVAVKAEQGVIRLHDRPTDSDPSTPMQGDGKGPV